MSISLSPPKKVVSEKQIEAVINKGGRATVETDLPADPSATKSIKLIMTAEEMDTIKKLRDKRPPVSRSRKITISVHDWVVEAIQEKIERERRKYSV
ncbi:hypothetical protein LZD49_33675 [Dyadobacter sp. CY261]|uniref:hypothetical protein n=1 Tax=Dyadobacter sp. CY261 TaxID=2907203 RepID=UPI001F319D62|nr:hypothetical protein [Dyadobacter sp. CY261]MCF0075477.1 hypothetical protein [Dyadobacter sp. CY261]